MASLKDKLRAGEKTIGSWITIGHPAIGEILARAGFDWIVIDLEHSTMSIDQAGELIRTIDLCGVAPLVRLTSNDINLAKRVLDAGAHGVVVPMVNSVEQAIAAVRYTRFPPLGARGVGLGRAQKYGPGFEAYLEWQKTEVVIIAQIEHICAVEEIGGILSTPGIDGFLIGPYDLSCSLGRPGDFEHADFKAAVARVASAGKLIGKPGGLHVVEPDPHVLRQVEDSGYTFNAFGVDFRFLDVGARVIGKPAS